MKGSTMKYFVIICFLFLGLSPASYGGTLWGFCKSNKAFHDPLFTKRKKEADKICKLKTAKEIGDPVAKARCLNSQNDICQNRKGEFGPNDVPNGAWYYVATGSVEYPRARCECGCFPAETRILTAEGYMPIADLLAAVSQEDHRLIIPTPEGLNPSPMLDASFFTVGDESQPLIRIVAENGRSITLTEIHPVPIWTGTEQAMVQAVSLYTGDTIYNADGSHVRIAKIERLSNKAPIKVYNVNTKAEGGDNHTLIAEGLMIGDLAWQNQLALRSSRINNFLEQVQP
jgi:hypothetical protein